jgi:hypothetical protein
VPEKLGFITPTVLKVLYVYHEDPMQELREREVMRKAKISKGSASLILSVSKVSSGTLGQMSQSFRDMWAERTRGIRCQPVFMSYVCCVSATAA